MNRYVRAVIGKGVFIFLILATSVFADELPGAIGCYRDSTQSKDIDAYMACFAANPKSEIYNPKFKMTE